MEGERIDYKSSGSKGPSLDVPPDLTQLNRDTRYAVPGTAVTASSYQAGQPTQAVTTAANTVGDVKIERAGTQRLLVASTLPKLAFPPPKVISPTSTRLVVIRSLEMPRCRASSPALSCRIGSSFID